MWRNFRVVSFWTLIKRKSFSRSKIAPNLKFVYQKDMTNMCGEKMNNFNIINYTLIFIKNGTKILLGLKKRGLGVGKYNGFGGKVQSNETLVECALRELKEESNLTTNNLKHLGACLYVVNHNKRIDLVHIYTSNEYSGTLEESEEMKPKWFEISKIPYDKMWQDAKDWHPLMLNEKYFFTYVTYKDDDTIVKRDIKEYDSITSVLKQVDSVKRDLLGTQIIEE